MPLAGPVPSPPTGRSWEELMALALEQARAGESQGEVPVGAVLAGRDGSILASAHNACLALNDPTAHAEILALRRAAGRLGTYRLGGTVLIASLEPCLMCAGALVHARVDGIVYGAADPLAGAVSSCLEAFALPFHNHAIWHMGGVAGEACAALLRDFFMKRR
ncbi:MAG: nucleoside deaminase [Deltaproteobacteria bacterium]|nr:nucleoside deaminase [Deltaproteobacteria bacterium]